jgi:hypothetical protein
MVCICVVFGCHNVHGRDSGVKFYRFPTILYGQEAEMAALIAKRRRLWIARVGCKDWVLSENVHVCSLHFASGELPRE